MRALMTPYCHALIRTNKQSMANKRIMFLSAMDMKSVDMTQHYPLTMISCVICFMQRLYVVCQCKNPTFDQQTHSGFQIQ